MEHRKQTARKSTTYIPESLRNPRNRNLGSGNQADKSNPTHSGTGDTNTQPDGNKKNPNNKEKDGEQSK